MTESPDRKQAPTDGEKFLALARERFKQAAEAETKIRHDAMDDLEFRAGRQWPTKIR